MTSQDNPQNAQEHTWDSESFEFHVCTACGTVRNKNGNKPCTGKMPTVEPRTYPQNDTQAPQTLRQEIVAGFGKWKRAMDEADSDAGVQAIEDTEATLTALIEREVIGNNLVHSGAYPLDEKVRYAIAYHNQRLVEQRKRLANLNERATERSETKEKI